MTDVAATRPVMDTLRDDPPPARPSQPPYAFLETAELAAIDSEWDLSTS